MLAGSPRWADLPLEKEVGTAFELRRTGLLQVHVVWGSSVSFVGIQAGRVTSSEVMVLRHAHAAVEEQAEVLAIRAVSLYPEPVEPVKQLRAERPLLVQVEDCPQNPSKY